jgi:integrase
MTRKHPKSSSRRSRSGPGLIQKKPGGIFYIRWSAQDPETGRWGSREKSTGTRKRVEAETVLREFEQNLGSRGRLPKQQTLEEVVAAWLTMKEAAGLTYSTMEGYRRMGKRLVEVLGKRTPIRELERSDFRRFSAELASRFGMAPRSRVKLLGILTQFLGWANREDFVRKNYAEGLTREVNQPPVARINETPEPVYEKLLAVLGQRACETDDPFLRRDLELLAGWVEFLWWTGLRSIEALRLTWKDVDLFKREIWVRSPVTKGGHRKIPVHTKANAVLLRRRKLADEAEARAKTAAGRKPDPILMRPFGSVEVAKTAWKRFKDSEPEFAGVHLHGLRHAFVSRLTRAGLQQLASYLVGHRSLGMTEHYTHLTPEDARNPLERLG